MRRILTILLFLWTLVPVSLASAQESGWQQLVTDVAPSARYDHILVAASDVNKLVLFGGRNGGNLGDTWIFDLTTNTWREVFANPAPEPRFGMAAAYDAERQRVVLFAGEGAVFYNDVWVFDVVNETWSLLTVSGAIPGIRYGTSAVVDPETDQLLISHGFSNGRYDDTFALDFNTNTWADVTPADVRPLNRCLHEAIFDPLSQQMILFGGCSSGYGPCPQGDLWSFANGVWTEVTPLSDLPAPRSNPSLVVDENSQVWLFGGATDSGKSNDLWRLDLLTNTWTAVFSDIAPTPRSSHDAVWHNGQLYIFGGNSDTGLVNDLWIFTPPVE